MRQTRTNGFRTFPLRTWISGKLRLTRYPVRESTTDGSLAKRGIKDVSVGPAQRLNSSSAMLALSVLLDSANEHYRGGFYNKAMYTPLVVSTLALLASGHGMLDTRGQRHHRRNLTYLMTLLTGIAGTGFHVYNIVKKPGGFSWQNLFYSGPLGAPAAIGLSGVMGVLSESVRNAPGHGRPTLYGVDAGRLVGWSAAIGLFGTTGEAALLHFRGAFHNPVMYLPIVMPPIAAVLLVNATLDPMGKRHRWTKRWLQATALMGIVGVGFHIYGVSRAMGGWRNWRQNMVDGPPIPAPPSFSALALAGLAALALQRTYSNQSLDAPREGDSPQRSPA